jgi:hypothetical protein
MRRFAIGHACSRWSKVALPAVAIVASLIA